MYSILASTHSPSIFQATPLAFKFNASNVDIYTFVIRKGILSGELADCTLAADPPTVMHSLIGLTTNYAVWPFSPAATVGMPRQSRVHGVTFLWVSNRLIGFGCVANVELINNQHIWPYQIASESNVSQSR